MPKRATACDPRQSSDGKMVHARVQYIGQPAPAVVWVWGAHEKVSVKRASAEEGKR